MLKSIFLSSAVLLCAATPAFAAPDPAPDATSLGGDSIIVTATRTPTALDRIASSVTVLDKEAIDRAQDMGVTELLARTPGVSLSRNGGYGTATSLRIRGAETDQTVVVIDGVKLNDPSATGGGYNFANMLVGDINRIEVLRGPQSTLWGSQAIGGVVNIVTAAPEGPIGATIDVEAGSRETVNARAGVGGTTGPVRWRLGGHAFTTEGISAYARGTERDGYRNVGLNGRVEIALAEGVSADLRGYWSRGRVEIDGFNTDSRDYSITDEFVGYAGLNFALFDGRLKNRIGYGHTETDRDSFNPAQAAPLTFDATGRNRRFEYQGVLDIAQGWTAIFGAEHEKSRFSSASPPFSPRVDGKAELTSFYGQLSGEVISGLTLSGGIRHDDHQTYGGKTLFSAGAVWALPTGTVLRASYGEGFKAPSLYQLFSEYGNRKLNPEQADGWDAGIEQHLFNDALTLGATWFQRDTTNQIDFFMCSDPADTQCVDPKTGATRFGYYANTQRTHARGIELAAAARIGSRFTATANYSWIEAENRSPGNNFGKWLARRPRQTANAEVSYTLPFGLAVGAAVRWSGKSYDNVANSFKLNSYTLVDLRLEQKIGEGMSLFGRVENLFDEKYQTVRNYSTLGRSIYAGVRARF